MNTARSTYHRIPIVCSAVSVQEELAEDFGQRTSSITGSHGILQYRYKRKVDSVRNVHCSITTDVLCYVCSMQTPFMVRNTSEMSTKVKKHLPVTATKVARSSLQATRVA